MTDIDVDDLLERWTDAERTGDRERLETLLAQDFVGIGPVGFVLPKAAWLDRLGPELHYEHLELTEVTSRHYGQTSIVVAHQHAVGEARGNQVPGDTRVSFVIVPSGGGDSRQIAAMQYSFMAAHQG